MASTNKQVQLALSYMDDVAKATDKLGLEDNFVARENMAKEIIRGDWALAKQALDAAESNGGIDASTIALLHFRSGNVWFVVANHAPFTAGKEFQTWVGNAVKAFEASIEAEWSPEAAYNLGLAYWMLRKKPEAVAALRKVADSDSRYAIDAQKEIGRIEAVKESSGCYIATACYGDYDHPDVRIFRGFRDQVLLRYAVGRAFVACYYKLSPAIANTIGRVGWLSKGIRRRVLEPLARRLREGGRGNHA